MQLMFTSYTIDTADYNLYNDLVNRGVLVSTKQQATSLEVFQLFYEELPATKRINRVRRVRAIS